MTRKNIRERHLPDDCKTNALLIEILKIRYKSCEKEINQVIDMSQIFLHFNSLFYYVTKEDYVRRVKLLYFRFKSRIGDLTQL
jgi:hypothetical protein